jgi:hypothetical protein
MLVDTGGNRDVVTGLTRRDRKFQAVRDEVPVLRHQKQQPAMAGGLR